MYARDHHALFVIVALGGAAALGLGEIVWFFTAQRFIERMAGAHPTLSAGSAGGRFQVSNERDVSVKSARVSVTIP